MTKGPSIDRFDTPLYTVAEAARYLDVPDSTFRSWTHGYHRRSSDRAEVSGAKNKVTIDAGQKTPATVTNGVTLSHDLYGDFFDRFDVAYRRELEVFFEDLVAGRTPLPGPEDALETLRLAVACTRSWRENRPVKLAEVTA